MKKLLIFVICVLLLAAYGCGAPREPGDSNVSGEPGASNVQNSNGATPTIEVTEEIPPPVGTEAVFGKQVKILAASNGDNPEFFEGFKQEADALGIGYEIKPGVSIADLPNLVGNCDAVVYYSNEQIDFSALSGVTVPVSIFGSGEVPSSVSLLSGKSGGAEALMEQAIIYPPHDTPVRLVGIFEREDSELSKTFKEYHKQGKVLPKQTFYKSGSTGFDSFFDKFLSNFFEGMVDGIVAETPELAKKAFDKLSAANRTDMEIFCLGIDQDIFQMMQQNPQVMAVAVGLNQREIGKALLLVSAGQIKDGTVVNETVGQVIHADEEQAAALQKYEKPWMQELRDYYK